MRSCSPRSRTGSPRRLRAGDARFGPSQVRKKEPVRYRARRPSVGNVAKILVVDDDHPVREVAVSYLRAGGHEVADVDTGEAALKAMRDDPADLVVLDLMLPGIDG